jgi:hypothetical protein
MTGPSGTACICTGQAGGTHIGKILPAPFWSLMSANCNPVTEKVTLVVSPTRTRTEDLSRKSLQFHLHRSTPLVPYVDPKITMFFVRHLYVFSPSYNLLICMYIVPGL